MTYTFDLAAVAGITEAHVRVIASDGLNTATDTSEGRFTVVPKAPMVFILAPADWQVYGPSAVVDVNATITDREAGLLDDDTFP